MSISKLMLVEMHYDFKDRGILAHDKPLNMGAGEITAGMPNCLRKSSISGSRLLSSSKMKPVVMCDVKTRKPLKAFQSAMCAGDDTGINASGIAKVARGEQHTAGGYYWKWGTKKGEENEP